jgi:putative MATE family efflux protein
MDQDRAQYVTMTERLIGPLITSLAVPTIVSMMVTSIYNMADTFFVSKLGTSASGAVGIVFSLMAIIQAVGFTVGMGSGSWISRLLGEKRTEEAGKVASSGFGLAILFGLGLSVVGLSNLDGLMRILGASATILPYARDYAGYILLAAPVMSASFVLNNILRAEGKAKFAMFGIGAGGMLNIALDPLFIFVFDLGIAGAAIATALSQCVSFLILLTVFLSGKTIVKIKPKIISKKVGTYISILTFGLPSLSRQGLASISTILLNTSAAGYGDAAVAAMAITGKIFLFIFSIILGIGQGYMPVLGYNYGARKFDRVRGAFFFTFKINTLIISVLALGGFFAAESLIRFFIAADPEVIRIGSRAFRFSCASMPLISLGVVCNMTFQSIGKAWTATILATLRQGICLIPLLLVLPRLIGLTGIQLAQPAADLLTFLCCIPFTLHFFRLLEREKRKTA